MTVSELIEELQEISKQEREVLMLSPKSDLLAYKERFCEPQVFLRTDGVVLIKPREGGY